MFDEAYRLLFEIAGIAGADRIYRKQAHSLQSEAILRLPPAELAKFRAWFAEFEAGRVNKKSGPQDTARRLGRIASRTFADFRKRLREP